ncbi:carbohydrate ABC transporter permease [Paenibacillus agaridevorans]|uniref:Carbohydrate ABC transporter permease n=1 Tax=Paenibacillus agaridevorans TaxID=171404 RepID=A0A2R5EQG7_9BACL|nr:carbohydrate ABC transporter permease [Paenibacillus agaridevorans]GBG08956.1 carbohydrate ABC transporter permease [Paenibacillus agaridevorans]
MHASIKGSRISTVIVSGVTILSALIFLLPVVLVVSASFTDENTLTLQGYSLLPGKWSLEAYRYILVNATQLYMSYRITIIVTLVGTLASLFVTSLLAYPLSRRSFTLRSKITFFVLFTMLFNGGLVPTYIWIQQYLELKNTFGILILTGLLSPFYVFIMRTFFKTIPDSIVESAYMEGAGEWRIFATIILPLSLPSLATIGMLTSLNYWNDWFTTLLYIEDKNKISLQYLLVMMMSNIQAAALNPNSITTAAKMPAETARMALAVLSIAPITIVFLFFQRFLVKGLTVGAVKE